MKKLFISTIAMFAVALGFTACSSDGEMEETIPQRKKVTVIATTEEPAAQRTTLGTKGADGKYTVVWSPKDIIKLGGFEFSLQSGEGTSTGEFTGFAPEPGTHTAYYPITYDGTTATWPTEQNYIKDGIKPGLPMKATGVTVDENYSVAPFVFKNDGGILRLNLRSQNKITNIMISTNELDKPITLDCGAGVQLSSTATPFCVAVPATDEGTVYSNLKIVIIDDEGKVCRLTLKSDKTVTVQRSMITDINLTLAPDKFFDYIELAGTKWATVNVGAVDNITPKTTDATYGYYYSQSDAIKAAASWGSNWTLPTVEQSKALIKEENCTWTWKKDYSFGGRTTSGYLVTDISDASKFIFLPAAGWLFNGEVNLKEKDVVGYYWLLSDNGYFYFNGNNKSRSVSDGGIYALNGLSVRPVYAEK